jgi:hypothetical protein
MNGCCNLSHQGFGPSRRVKSGSTADTAAGGPLDGVTVTILNADKQTEFFFVPIGILSSFSELPINVAIRVASRKLVVRLAPKAVVR